MPQDDKAPPLPLWMVRFFSVFALVLYVPDMYFNFFVYSDGVASFDPSNPLTYPQIALWGFLSAGIVGMTWLCSMLAPWHWLMNRRFASIMCWLAVFICSAVTTWCSLAFRSRTFVRFPTDDWLTSTFHITVATFSPTMIVVAVMPPLLGLFYAIVQPITGKRSTHEQEEAHDAKLARMRQQSEERRLRAELSAAERKARVAGWRQTVQDVRDQMSSTAEDPAPSEDPVDEPVQDEAPPVAAFPALRRGRSSYLTPPAAVTR